MLMKPLICFSHLCDPSAKVTVFSLPGTCPLCQSDLSVSPFATNPFSIPTPFAMDLAESCSVILKPSKGDFLHTYVPGADLHVGIVDSKGRIVSFDSPGVVVQMADAWPNHLSIVCGLEEFSEDITRLWDLCLEETCHQYNSKEVLKYDPEGQNCFDFVVFFLKLVAQSAAPVKTDWSQSKDELIDERIKPKMWRISKFISIYRHVAKNGWASF